MFLVFGLGGGAGSRGTATFSLWLWQPASSILLFIAKTDWKQYRFRDSVKSTDAKPVNFALAGRRTLLNVQC
jgi:hypothetical protein